MIYLRGKRQYDFGEAGTMVVPAGTEVCFVAVPVSTEVLKHGYDPRMVAEIVADQARGAALRATVARVKEVRGDE